MDRAEFGFVSNRYYTAATGPEEWWQPHAPVWKAVGRYARFNQAVSTLADGYIRSILDVEKNAKMPEVSRAIIYASLSIQGEGKSDLMNILLFPSLWFFSSSLCICEGERLSGYAKTTKIAYLNWRDINVLSIA